MIACIAGFLVCEGFERGLVKKAGVEYFWFAENVLARKMGL